ncbi:MAG: hypothetical protein JW973_10215 [Bacteroidales bacterium]|nr:hypothetical protein [Bacteroidales bacterium]
MKTLLLIILLSIGNRLFSQSEILFSIEDKKYYTDEFEYYYKKNHGDDVIKYLELYVQFSLKIFEGYRLGYDKEERFIKEFKLFEKEFRKGCFDFETYLRKYTEYYDGIILFNFMNDFVWSKALKDTVGLYNFYKQNKKQYNSDFIKNKGLITTDYQTYLEENLVNDLFAKYTIIFSQNELNNLVKKYLTNTQISSLITNAKIQGFILNTTSSLNQDHAELRKQFEEEIQKEILIEREKKLAEEKIQEEISLLSVKERQLFEDSIINEIIDGEKSSRYIISEMPPTTTQANYSYINHGSRFNQFTGRITLKEFSGSENLVIYRFDTPCDVIHFYEETQSGSIGLKFEKYFTSKDNESLIYAKGVYDFPQGHKSVIRFIGKHKFRNNFTFEGEEDFPLTFVFIHPIGFVYLYGKGIVTTPMGKKVYLP